MTQLALSVIVAFRNDWENLRRCVRSLREHVSLPAEVILVQDAGNREPYLFPNALLLETDHQLGHGGAMNFGARHAHSDVLVFMDADTEVTDGWDSELLSGFCAGDKIAAVGPRSARSGPPHDQGGPFRSGEYEAVPFLSSFCVAVSRKAWNQVGIYDEHFFPLYYDDVDWCHRAKLAGWQLLLSLGATVHHYPNLERRDEDTLCRSETRLFIKWPEILAEWEALGCAPQRPPTKP